MLEKINRFSPLIATLVIPIVLAFIGNQYTTAVKEREVQGDFVVLAVDILKQKPTVENRNIREWATSILDKYSGVALSEAAANDLIQNISFDQSQDFEVKDIGLKIDMKGGPVSVKVISESGHKIDYHIELLVDGNYDTNSDNKPLVFSPSLIKDLKQHPQGEGLSEIQMALHINDDISKNKYSINILCEQNGKILTESRLEGKLSETGPERTLILNIIEVE